MSRPVLLLAFLFPVLLSACHQERAPQTHLSAQAALGKVQTPFRLRSIVQPNQGRGAALNRLRRRGPAGLGWRGRSFSA